MELLDRYLAAIARDLPRRQADDIVAELRDILLSKIEEKEASLGRPLERKELEALLVEFGHPLGVAARYRGTRSLIGPGLFPFWWAALRVVFVCAGAIYLGTLLIRIGMTQMGAAEVIRQSLPAIWPGVLGLFGAVTLVFALIERLGGPSFRVRWSPRQLPPVQAPLRKRVDLAIKMTLGVLFLLWWAGYIRFSDFLPMPPLKVTLASTWAPLYWPILAFGAADLLVSGLELFRPGWLIPNAGLSLVKNIVGALLAMHILRAGHWIDIGAPHMPAEALAKAQAAFDAGMRLGLLVTAFLYVTLAMHDVWRLVLSRRVSLGGTGAGVV
jgi:hypothetical protein